MQSRILSHILCERGTSVVANGVDTIGVGVVVEEEPLVVLVGGFLGLLVAVAADVRVVDVASAMVVGADILLLPVLTIVGDRMMLSLWYCTVAGALQRIRAATLEFGRR